MGAFSVLDLAAVAFAAIGLAVCVVALLRWHRRRQRTEAVALMTTGIGLTFVAAVLAIISF